MSLRCLSPFKENCLLGLELRRVIVAEDRDLGITSIGLTATLWGG